MCVRIIQVASARSAIERSAPHTYACRICMHAPDGEERNSRPLAVGVQVIARNALKQESEEDIYLPDTIDVTEQRSTSGSSCAGNCSLV